MPWTSPTPYRDLEQAPLSAQDDDDDDMPLPPYSDTPPNSEHSDVISNGDANGGSRHRGANGAKSKSNNAHKAITIQEETSFLSRRSVDRGYDGAENEEEDDDGGGGDYHNSATPSKSKRPTRYYRGSLLCAYLKYFATCQCCCNCCADNSTSSRNIGGYSPQVEGRRNARCKRVLMALFYIFLFILILICAASIGYIIAQDGSPFQPDESSSGSEVQSNNNNNNNGNKLPPPPDNLHEICTDWITAAGREKCQNECNVSKCCALPTSDKNSCWGGQAAICATYRAACMAMELHTDDLSGPLGGNIDEGGKTRLDAPKPSYLDQICSLSSLQTPDGFERCSEECRPSRCCHPETYGCEVVEEDKRWCDAYEKPCAGVAESWRGSGHAVSSSDNAADDKLTNQVILKCNAANLNPPDECIEACHPGACCYISDEYPPIEQLFNEHYASQSPMHTVDSCSANVGFCQQYGACEHLNHLKDTSGWHSDTVTYELDITKVCRVEYIAQFGALECSNVCQPAHCCFSGEYQCDDVNLGHLDCGGDYRECGVLYPGYKTVEELFQLARDINDACSENSLGTGNGRSKCQFLCRDRLCCFESGAYGCANDPLQNCEAYAGCETLVSTPLDYANNDEGTNKSTGGGTDTDGVDAFITALESACSEKSLQTIAGIQLCHNKCQTHLCCFTSDETLAGNDCSNIHVDACSAYQPCKRLVTPPNSENQPSATTDLKEVAENVEKACSLPNDPYLINQSWVSNCHSACASRLCCLVDAKIGSNCRATLGTEECNAYSACDVLISNSGKEMTEAKQIEEKFGDIESVCNDSVMDTSTKWDACDERCQQRSCCFENTLAYSCYHMEKDWCEEFSSCEYVEYDFLVTNPPTPRPTVGNVSSSNKDVQQSFKTLCTTSALQQNWEACKNHCTQFECCFRSKDSCYQQNELECDEYAICEEFYDMDEDSPSTNTAPTVNSGSGQGNDGGIDAEVDAFITALESACSESSLQKLEGIQLCHNKCQTHLCCFTSDETLAGNDCSNIHVEACSAYQPCKRLVTPPNSENQPSATTDLKEIAENVETACSLPDDPYLINQSWISNCHSVCASRLCCLVDAKIGSNCRSTLGIEECNAYSACDVLINYSGTEMTEAKQIEEKFGDIESVCNEETAQSSSLSKACDERCEQRSCCFEDTFAYSCYHMEKDWCEEFSACSFAQYTFLVTNPTTPRPTNAAKVSEPSSNSGPEFKTLCTTSATLQQNWEACKNHCTQFECCFRSKDSCYQQNKYECNEYASCEEFYDVDDGEEDSNASDLTHSGANNDAAPPAPKSDAFQSAIADACSVESLKTLEGIQQCFHKCQAHLCCVPADALEADFDCSDTFFEECNTYYLCDQLVDQYQLWKPPSTAFDPFAVKVAVNDACSLPKDSSQVTEEWIANCHQHCEARMCCFTNSPHGSCIDVLGHDECDDYSACKVLIGVEENSNSVDDVCNNDVSSNSELFMDCREKCKERSCCFENDPSYSCYEMSKDWCEDYEVCKLVGLTFLGSESSTAIQTNEAESVDFDQIDAKCSQEYLLSFGMEACEYLCDKVKCCFEFSQCAYPNQSDCDRVDACNNFYNPSSEDLIVEKLCSEEELNENELPCKDACEPYECCFTGSPCSSSIDLECDEYEPCRYYFETYAPDFKQPPLQESFKDLCSPSQIGKNWDSCKAHCEQFACCFRSEFSCYQENEVECDEDYFCEEFYKDTVATTTLPTKVQIVEDKGLDDTELLILARACNTDKLQIDDTECRMLCQGSKCCFSKTSPCSGMEKFCDDHAICSSMFT